MTVYCDYCGHKAELVDDTVIYGHSYGHKAYLCRYCGAYVGCHGRSDKPMGRLADAGLRRKKMEAHAAFDLETRPIPRPSQRCLCMAGRENGTARQADPYRNV